ncbi:OLC1v1011237C1 [Oldenlandia corymbosa var. corymbosa]|uniref:Protein DETOXIFICATION n=1 Tax=Oldenlandia corymbosa var. corymbosa TaxID=529605 RepID=A0AAV1DW74_OLDCO|nr:OLC1v1011237C1 [Oldenlandia corymbosa var. corymbosa]
MSTETSHKDDAKVPLLQPRSTSAVQTNGTTESVHEEDDQRLTRRVFVESKKLWRIVGPAIFGRIASYSTIVVSQAFAGHLGDLELAGFSIATSVINSFNYGFFLGMASALETLCGQAYGAKRYSMLGIYLQRSWIVLLLCGILTLPLYIFATPILKLLGQPDDVAEISGTVALYLIPLHFSYTLSFPLQRFLQSQLKNYVTALVQFGSFLIHVMLSWLVVSKFKLGLVGAAVVLNISWWFMVVGLLVYCLCGGCPQTWTGFSVEAFSGLWEFLKLSASSGVMLCLESWYYRILTVMTGNLPNAKIAIDALSVCMNINGWITMIPIGFFAGTGVRVANELGAGNGKAAKFASLVSVIQSSMIGLFFSIIIIFFHNELALIFTESPAVLEAVHNLSLFLAFTIPLNSVQFILSGVAVGSGWQAYVAYINLGCYYLLGVPSGLIMGWLFHFGVMGIWAGMILGGTAVQTIILATITARCDWEKEPRQVVHEEDDKQHLTRRVLVESKKLWSIVGPAIFGRIASYSTIVVSQAFAGHLGDLELAGFSIATGVISSFNYGLFLGMASALETLCGQAYGAKRYSMLGIYLQRSWIILFLCGILTLPLYIFATPILKLLGQPDDVAEISGTVSLYLIPLHFSYTLSFPLQRFLQSQLKMYVTALVQFGSFLIHVMLSWLVVSKFELGLVGTTVVLNISWWFIVVGHLVYCLYGGCPQTWTGFSVEAFSGLWEFLKLSVSSGVMLCLESWYYKILTVMTGNLPNAKIAIDALSVCMNIQGWIIMIPFGFFAGTGVRVANELGAGNGKAAKFASIVSVIQCTMIGLFFLVIIILFPNELGLIFTESPVVLEAVHKLSLLLAFTIPINCVQFILSGVAVGSGWQAYVAYINLGCYYLLGVPSGLIMGWLFHFGVSGIWAGMIGGTAVQTIILAIITARCDWEKEAEKAKTHVEKWEGRTRISK